MSAPGVVAVADAVLYELQHPAANADIDFTDWSLEFTAERTFNSEQKLEDAQDAKVFVVPGRSPSSLGSRGTLQGDLDIAVFLRQKMAAQYTDSSVEDLIALLEEMNTYFAHIPNGLLRQQRAIYESAEMTPFFPARLRTLREYLGCLILTFRTYED